MKREFRVVLNVGGVCGPLFVSTLTMSGALRLVAARFPSALVVWVSEVRN